MNESQKQAGSIVADIEDGVTYQDCGLDCEEYGAEPGDIISGHDYLSDALDIEYVVSGAGEYLGARVLVGFGGPNIWIDTNRRCVDVHWWSESASVSYADDIMDIDGALEEIFRHS